MASIAALMADPTRAEMLIALMDGRAFPASELASIAHVSPSTASHHLSCLVQGGLVEVIESGRHRYHRLAGRQVADVIEAMGVLVRPERPSRKLSAHAASLAGCRTCYDHLAGKLGVELRMRLLERGILFEDGDRYGISGRGEAFLSEFGIDVEDLRRSKRQLSKACLDWTERVPHIGGALGAALYQRLTGRGWLIPGALPRSLVVTPIGSECLETTFGICREQTSK